MKCLKWCGLMVLALGFVVACQAHASDGPKELRSGDNYQVLAAARTLAGKPLAGELEVRILRKGEWKLTTNAPMSVKLSPPEGVVFRKKTWKNADAAKLDKDVQARFLMPYTLKAAGSYDLKLDFSFVLCTETLCQKKRFEVDYRIKA